MMGGWTRSLNLDAGNAAFYKCTGSNNSTYREGMIIAGPRVYKDKIDRWEIIRMKDSLFLDPILLLKDIPSGTEFERQAQQLCNKGYVNEVDLLNPYLNFATNVAGGGRRKKKTRKKRGGEKSKRVKSLIKIFQQYPEIFPSGYFRFLGARLQNHIDKKTLWYKNGVILTWIKYQKTVKKKPKCIIKPGDVKLDQIVNKNQGNGAAKKIVLQFLKKFEKNRIWLEVRANNKRAIRFYKDRGFKRVCKIKFGEIPGIMMLKQV